MIYWYYCKDCGIKFSWVFTGLNDCKHCLKCESSDIERVGICWREIKKELKR